MDKKEKKKKIGKVATKKGENEVEMLPYEIDVDQILLHSRQVFLSGVIDDSLARRINRELLALAEIDDKPIAMWINSPGGSCPAGFSIIDTMVGLNVPVFTFVNGYACSMAALISVAGDKRIMTKHSTWMAHEAVANGSDYITKLINRVEHLKDLDKTITTHLKKYTKLTKTDLAKARKGELWLTANQCKRKGVVDVLTRK